MSPRTVSFAFSLAAFVACLVGVAAYYIFIARRRSRSTWETLLARLAEVDRKNVELLALDLLCDTTDATGEREDCGIDPSRVYSLIGGMEGLKALEANCAVIIDIACFVQQWYPDALIVAEQLRLNARAIDWHVSRLKAAAAAGTLEVHFADYGQRAVATYYVMTQSLLELCKRADLPAFAELQRAI